MSPQVLAAELVVEHVVRVHDGDTLAVDLADCPIEVLCKRVSVRIAGIDAPEMTDHRPNIKLAAIRAKAELLALVASPHTVRLVGARRDKYFRLLAGVESDGVSVARHLLDAGLAKPYAGAGPKPW
jgi:endonuclease YncB( thermonuclease family)